MKDYNEYDDNKDYCMVCNKELNYKVEYCCRGFSGHNCGCLGMPTEPPVCSSECYDKVIQINKDLDELASNFNKNLDK